MIFLWHIMFERKGDIGFLRSAPEKDDLGYVYYYYYYYYYISLLLCCFRYSLVITISAMYVEDC